MQNSQFEKNKQMDCLFDKLSQLFYFKELHYMKVLLPIFTHFSRDVENQRKILETQLLGQIIKVIHKDYH